MIWNQTIIKIARPLHESRNTRSQLNGNVIPLRLRAALSWLVLGIVIISLGISSLREHFWEDKFFKGWAQVVQKGKFCSCLLLRPLDAINNHRGIFSLSSCGWHMVIVVNAKCHPSAEGSGMPGARGDLHTLSPGPCKATLSSNTLNFKIWFSSSFPLFFS